ncbi:MAG: hypothetical protein ACKOCH_01210, partial [Bacteroidota bacterium]
EGTIWTGSYLDGFVRLDMNRRTSGLVPLPSDNKLEHQVFPGKYAGPGGELLFGGYRGIYVLQNGVVRLLNLKESVEAFVFDRENDRYYAAGTSIFIIDRNLEHKTGEIKVPGSVSDGVGLSSLKITPDGSIWVSGKRGIACMESDGLVRKVYDLQFPCVCLETDAENTLWAGTGNGIFRYDTDRDTFIRVMQEVVSGAVNSLVPLPGQRLAVVTD